jgi:hypothetical protein
MESYRLKEPLYRQEDEDVYMRKEVINTAETDFGTRENTNSIIGT